MNFKKLLLLSLLFISVSAVAQNFDIDLLKNINVYRDKQLFWFFKFLTDSVSFIAYGVPVVFAGISVSRKNKSGLRKAIYILISVASAGIFSNLLKLIVHRQRPFITYPFIEKLSSGGGFSFPSGHTTDAFSLATAVCLLFPRWYVIVPMYGWAASVGYSRMYLGVHFPTDVLGGAIFASSIAFLIYKTYYASQLKKI